MVRGDLVQAARQAIERRCGIAPGAVMISASHSHSSGPVGMIQPGEYDHASEFVQKLAYEHSSAADAGYLELVEKQIVAAVCQADAAREPALCGFGSGREDQVAFNRRFRMKNGLTYTHPGKGIRISPGSPDRLILKSASSARGTTADACWAASSTSPVMERQAQTASPPTGSFTWKG